MSRKPKEYQYIKVEEELPLPIRWWDLLYKIRGQGYVLNLNISSQVKDLQKILLFDYAAEMLEKNGLIHPLDDERLR